jgi:hypothetical protein
VKIRQAAIVRLDAAYQATRKQLLDANHAVFGAFG